MKGLGWFLFVVTLIILLSNKSSGQDRESIVLKNAQYALELHEYWVEHGTIPLWDSDWILNYKAQLGQDVDVPDIRIRRESGYYTEEIGY